MLPTNACLLSTMRNSRGHFTLDQLLETKRAEKPSSDFWGDFENELRIKQRRMLQKQPVEDLGTENLFWYRTRRISAMCCAAASCGVIGFVLMNTFQPTAETSVAKIPALAESTVTVADEPTFIVERNASSSPLVAAVEPAETVFYEVPAPDKAELEAAVASSVQENENAVILASHSPAASSSSSASVEDFTLAIDIPFEAIDPDKSIAFNADVDVTAARMEKYLHPLSDRGHKYSQVTNTNHPLDSISAMAIHSQLFNSNSRKARRLNTLSLSF